MKKYILLFIYCISTILTISNANSEIVKKILINGNNRISEEDLRKLHLKTTVV